MDITWYFFVIAAMQLPVIRVAVANPDSYRIYRFLWTLMKRLRLNSRFAAIRKFCGTQIYIPVEIEKINKQNYPTTKQRKSVSIAILV